MPRHISLIGHKRNQKGPPSFSKGTSRDGKGPVPSDEDCVCPPRVRRRLEAENGALKGSIETLSGSIKNTSEERPSEREGDRANA